MNGHREFSWLPDHQTHVVATLAHADGLIETVGNLIFDYNDADPFTLESVPDGPMAHVVVSAIKPLPDAVSRLAADALTTIRAAIEHVIYADVEFRLGRRLAGTEQNKVDMPACPTRPKFQSWLRDTARRRIAPLTDGSELTKRIESLQPFHRREAHDHPMAILADHTNFAKHRAPAVTMTRIGAVIPDFREQEIIVSPRTKGGQPVSPGDILASGPRYVRVPLSIWPVMSIQRPRSGTWHVIMEELGDLEYWARTIAIPTLITGSVDGVPKIPPAIDISVGYDDIRGELLTAGTVPARDRSMRRMQARIARDGLLNVIAAHSSRPDGQTIAVWLAGSDDDAVLELHHRLSEVVHDPLRLNDTVKQMIEEATVSG